LVVITISYWKKMWRAQNSEAPRALAELAGRPQFYPGGDAFCPIFHFGGCYSTVMRN
jgi:hypothetical protein